MKKLLQKLAILGIIIMGVSGAVVAPAYAEDVNDTSCPTFLGMRSWDCGVDTNPGSEDELTTMVWAIVGNVIIDATILAAYCALGFVIYGGYLYIFSGGDPNKTASGKKTLSHAFIGLAIAMLATVIMSTIRIVLMNGDTQLASVDGADYASEMATSIIQWVIGIAGFVSAIFLVYGGISYMTSSGDAGKLTKAKNMIIYALIGLTIVGLAEIITAFVTNIIKDSKETTSLEQTSLIAYEEVK